MRLLLEFIFWATLLSWVAHAGWIPLSVPWHEAVPFVFWATLLTLLMHPAPSRPTEGRP